MKSKPYKPCYLCKRVMHQDELIVWGMRKYQTTTVIKRICLFCVEGLNDLKRKNEALAAMKAEILALKAAAA